MSLNVLKGGEEPEVGKEEFLALTPVKNPKLTWETTSEGEVTLTIPPRLFGLGRTKKVIFDQMGSYVVELIDGGKTVEDIIQTVCATQKLKEEEARISVVTFLQTLERRGFIQMEARGWALGGARKFCKECGRQIPAKALFCPQCGTKQR